jgi:DNA topoisomerase-3
LILWLDCDREGENIAFEVVDVVKEVNPKIKVLRAKFSSLTEKDIKESLDNLQQPNKNLSDAVDIRQKIDLLIGATFTRLQTICYKNLFKDYSNKSFVISYGPCQFPTLNFIVERADKIEQFTKEKFYFLELVIKKAETIVKFDWDRERLFDKQIVETLEEKVLSHPNGKVIHYGVEEKTRARPIPLNTVEFQKLVSRKLKISSHVAMDIAEKLYQKGYISYPRTETQKYRNTEIPQLKRVLGDLGAGIGYLWCKYAKSLNFKRPRDGKLDDKAHPPIHPVKYVHTSSMSELENKIYNFIVIYFLATVSEDAKGNDTTVKVEIGGEEFTSSGFTLTHEGFLEIYPLDNFQETTIPKFNIGEKIKLNKNADICLKTSKTAPPSYLTESELISLMDRYGIGTDSTIHEHIKHVAERGYSTQIKSMFKPTLIGSALIKAYRHIGIELYKPYLRSAMEKEMKNVADGLKQSEAVYQEMKKEMEKIFDSVMKKTPQMQKFLKDYLNTNNEHPKIGSSAVKNTELSIECPGCNENKMKIKQNNSNMKYFLGCSGYPTCKAVIGLKNPISIEVTDENCDECKNKLYIMTFGGKAEKTEKKCLSECVFKEKAVPSNNHKKNTTILPPKKSRIKKALGKNTDDKFIV